MPSTYTPDLRLELQANGENSSTWGTKLNSSIQQIEDAIAGMIAVATTGGDTTLTTVNGGTDQSRYAMLKITGTLVSNSNIIVPDASKEYLIWNATSGAYTVTVRTAAGSGVVVTQGATAHVFCDATNVLLAAGGSAQAEVFTNKTLTSPAINGAVTTTGLTLPALTLGGAIAGNSQNISGLGTLGCGAITSAGAIAGTSLNIGTGALTAGSGTFSGALTLGSSSTSLNHVINNADLSSGGISIQAAGVTKGWLGPARAYYADGAGDVDMSIVSNGASVRIGTGSGGNTVHTFSSTGLAVTGAVSASGSGNTVEAASFLTSGNNYNFIRIGNNSSGTLAGIYVGAESTAGASFANSSANAGIIAAIGNRPLQFGNNGTVLMTLDASGNLLVGTTSGTYRGRFYGSASYGGIRVDAPGSGSYWPVYFNDTDATSTSQILVDIRRGDSRVGYITTTDTASSYQTSSDYRLKYDVSDLIGSGAFIDALKPRSWTWKINGERGTGFIAHELQEVSPSSVCGERDAVDEDGNPEYQGVEYGSAEVIANIVAELQSVRARLAALEAK